MAKAAVLAGLDGLVITEHDVLWPENELRDLQERHPKLVILNGVELSLNDTHLLVYGIDRIPEKDELSPLLNALEKTQGDDTFRAVAHPFRYEPTHSSFIFLAGLTFEGVEVGSENIGERDGRMARELAKARHLVEIAGSDAHSVEMIGRNCTVFDHPIRTMEDLVSALRQGRCRPHVG